MEKENYLHILVTNDHDISSPGLLALTQEMRRLGKVSILAHDKNWSETRITNALTKPLWMREVHLADGSFAYSAEGSPADCVAHAVSGFLEEKMDFVVAGINPHATTGHQLTNAGPTTSVMEAAIRGVPAISFSVDAPARLEQISFQSAARIAYRVVRNVLRLHIPKYTYLNVNIPYLPEQDIQGIQITRQGLRLFETAGQQSDPYVKSDYWIVNSAPTSYLRVTTDAEAVANGYVSVTPIQVDLTAYHAISTLNAWDWKAQEVQAVMLGTRRAAIGSDA